MIDVDGLVGSISLPELIGRDVPLTQDGREWKGLCPFHNERSPSFTVYAKGGAERFHCFGCGERGDAVDYVMKMDGVDFLEAIKRLGGGSDQPVRKREPRPAVEHVDIYAGYAPMPIEGDGHFEPGKMTPMIFNPKRAGDEKREWGRFKPSLVHAYRSPSGHILGYVLRHDLGDGKKETPMIQRVRRPAGDDVWARVPFLGTRPLYGLDRIAARPDAPVVVVEGEKAADAGHILPGYVVVSWAGGSQSYSRADWSPLAGRRVLLCPDADEPGIKAMRGWYRDNGELVEGIADLLVKVGAASIKLIEIDTIKGKA